MFVAFLIFYKFKFKSTWGKDTHFPPPLLDSALSIYV